MKMYTVAIAIGVAAIGFINVTAKAVPHEGISRLRSPDTTSSRATADFPTT